MRQIFPPIDLTGRLVINADFCGEIRLVVWGRWVETIFRVRQGLATSITNHTVLFKELSLVIKNILCVHR